MKKIAKNEERKPSGGAGEEGLYPTARTCWIQDITFALKLQVFFEKFFSKQRQKRTFGGTHKFKGDFPGKVMKLCGLVSAGRQGGKSGGDQLYKNRRVC